MKNDQSCEYALRRLKKGNDKHIIEVEAIDKNKPKAYKLKATNAAQQPFAAILSCADSRVIPEHIFQTREGELFVVRVAGNIAEPATMASLEYAVSKLGVKVILVMGHQSCGAVEATYKVVREKANLGYNLNQMASFIIPAFNGLHPIDDLEKATKENAKQNAQALAEHSAILNQYVKDKKLLICAAYYPLGGHVEWLGTCECPPKKEG